MRKNYEMNKKVMNHLTSAYGWDFDAVMPKLEEFGRQRQFGESIEIIEGAEDYILVKYTDTSMYVNFDEELNPTDVYAN